MDLGGTNRAGRVGVRSGLVAGTLALIVRGCGRAHSCRPVSGTEMSCLGDGLHQAAAAILLGWVLGALALRGRGLLHSAVGSAVGISLGLVLTYRLGSVVGKLPEDTWQQDLAFALLLGLAAGSVIGLWASLVPVRGRPGR